MDDNIYAPGGIRELSDALEVDRRQASDRREIAEWLVATGFPFDWGMNMETPPPDWLLDELAAAWHRKDAYHGETVEDYKWMLIAEAMAFRGDEG